MTHEEFIARAEEVRTLDPDLWRQLRQLYVEKGTLQQLVRAMLDFKRDVQETLANTHMISQEDIHKAIGLQGNVRGIDNVLGLIFNLMQEPQQEAEDVET